MNPGAITVVFAEAALAVNVPLRLLYTRQPLGAAVAVALMAMTWTMHRWSTR